MKEWSTGKSLFNKKCLRTFYFRGIISVWLAGCVLNVIYAQPAGYYDPASGKSGEELQLVLHQIIDDHTVLSYSDLWTAFRSTDKKADGTVWDMYSDIPGGEPPYEYTFGTDQCGNYSGEGSCYNREHSFPKSWFNDASPMYTDLFHLYPTDGYVNGKRSNYPFGETENPSWTSLNGSEVGPCSVNGYSGTVFEPIDAYKGDFARTYFYMATRYYGEDGGWTGSPMVTGAQLEPWAREMMVRWHTDDPVSEKELSRNDAVYALQGNRNPFIDHPEYVQLMYGGANFDEMPPDIDSITVSHEAEMILWFNEPLDSSSAVQPDHYTVSGGVEVIYAVLDPEEKSVVSLEVSGLQNGSYTLTINGVSDTSGNALQLAIFPFEVAGLSLQFNMISTRSAAVYPNPSTGSFFVDPGSMHGDLRGVNMTDITGRIITLNQSFRDDLVYLQTDARPGTYLLTLKFSTGLAETFTVMVF